MTDDPVLERLRALITSARRSAPTDVHPDTRLDDHGVGLDSLELFQLLVACEREFDLTFDPRLDLTPATLATVGSLAERIRVKRRS
jgi:acyl carrier protein